MAVKHSEKLLEIKIMHELMSIAELMTDTYLYYGLYRAVRRLHYINEREIEIIYQSLNHFIEVNVFHADNTIVESLHGIDAGFIDRHSDQYVLGLQFKIGHFTNFSNKPDAAGQQSIFHRSVNNPSHYKFEIIKDNEKQFRTLYINNNDYRTPESTVHFCLPCIDYSIEDDRYLNLFLPKTAFENVTDIYNNLQKSYSDNQENIDEIETNFIFYNRHNLRIGFNDLNLRELNYYYYYYNYKIKFKPEHEICILRLQNVLKFRGETAIEDLRPIFEILKNLELNWSEFSKVNNSIQMYSLFTALDALKQLGSTEELIKFKPKWFTKINKENAKNYENLTHSCELDDVIYLVI